MHTHIKTRALKILYVHLVKPVFFLFHPETVHRVMTDFGQSLGRFAVTRKMTASFFEYQNTKLEQTIAGIRVENPIGLSAGFDYRAQLPFILPSIGMGFGTVGTITNLPYEGNPKPMLGRLPKSKSLLVNKGFKNDGIDVLIKKMNDQSFDIPIGLSLGKTNRKEAMTQEEAVQDVTEAFSKAVKANLPFSYYELNISCPNLYGSVSFYEPEKLEALLASIATTHPGKPVFLKMPITESNETIEGLLRVAAKHTFITGVIFGNLWKDRTSDQFDAKEIARATKGNFSGKPTANRSNELIALAYTKYANRFTVIGCGGVFTAEDAYKKIRLGASLVQMITGMIFEGPQVIGEINQGLVHLLKRDGFQHISDAIGVDTK